MKNDASMAPSWPQNRTARRVASKPRISLGKLTFIGVPCRGCDVARIMNSEATEYFGPCDGIVQHQSRQSAKVSIRANQCDLVHPTRRRPIGIRQIHLQAAKNRPAQP